MNTKIAATDGKIKRKASGNTKFKLHGTDGEENFIKLRTLCIAANIVIPVYNAHCTVLISKYRLAHSPYLHFRLGNLPCYQFHRQIKLLQGYVLGWRFQRIEFLACYQFHLSMKLLQDSRLCVLWKHDSRGTHCSKEREKICSRSICSTIQKQCKWCGTIWLRFYDKTD